MGVGFHPPHFHLALTSTGAPSGSSSKTSSPATRAPTSNGQPQGFLGGWVVPPPTCGLCPEFQGCSTAGQAPRPAACPPLDSAGVQTRVQSQSGVSRGDGLLSPPLAVALTSKDEPDGRSSTKMSRPSRSVPQRKGCSEFCQGFPWGTGCAPPLPACRLRTFQVNPMGAEPRPLLWGFLTLLLCRTLKKAATCVHSIRGFFGGRVALPPLRVLP